MDFSIYFRGHAGEIVQCALWSCNLVGEYICLLTSSGMPFLRQSFIPSSFQSCFSQRRKPLCHGVVIRSWVSNNSGAKRWHDWTVHKNVYRVKNIYGTVAEMYRRSERTKSLKQKIKRFNTRLLTICARAHAQLSNMHQTETHLNVLHGENN